ERVRAMPSSLIEQHDGVGARRHGGSDLNEMQRHSLGVASRQDERRAFAFGRADRPVDIGRTRPLILWRRRPCSASGPATRNPVLLADPSFILPPQLYWRAGRERRPDRCQLGWEVFLKEGMASVSWA